MKIYRFVNLIIFADQLLNIGNKITLGLVKL